MSPEGRNSMARSLARQGCEVISATARQGAEWAIALPASWFAGAQDLGHRRLWGSAHLISVIAETESRVHGFDEVESAHDHPAR